VKQNWWRLRVIKRGIEGGIFPEPSGGSFVTAVGILEELLIGVEDTALGS
jgi:hypothetical protein